MSREYPATSAAKIATSLRRSSRKIAAPTVRAFYRMANYQQGNCTAWVSPPGSARQCREGRKLVGIIVRTKRPEPAAARPHRPFPAARSATMRARRGTGKGIILNRTLAGLVEWLRAWNRRRRDRRLLAGLDDRVLRDMGIDRVAVERDSAMSFWRQLR